MRSSLSCYNRVADWLFHPKDQRKQSRSSVNVLCHGLPPSHLSRFAAVVEAVVPTACLSTGPWYKGLYN